MQLAVNSCPGTSDLVQVTPVGQITHVGELTPLEALHTGPNGRFLAADAYAVYKLSLDSYSLTLLDESPGAEPVPPGGLAADGTGSIYVSTGSLSPDGQVYRLDASGEVTLLAEISGNGLSRIEWLSDTGEIVG